MRWFVLLYSPCLASVLRAESLSHSCDKPLSANDVDELCKEVYSELCDMFKGFGFDEFVDLRMKGDHGAQWIFPIPNPERYDPHDQCRSTEKPCRIHETMIKEWYKLKRSLTDQTPEMKRTVETFTDVQDAYKKYMRRTSADVIRALEDPAALSLLRTPSSPFEMYAAAVKQQGFFATAISTVVKNLAGKNIQVDVVLGDGRHIKSLGSIFNKFPRVGISDDFEAAAGQVFDEYTPAARREYAAEIDLKLRNERKEVLASYMTLQRGVLHSEVVHNYKWYKPQLKRISGLKTIPEDHDEKGPSEDYQRTMFIQNADSLLRARSMDDVYRVTLAVPGIREFMSLVAAFRKQVGRAPSWPLQENDPPLRVLSFRNYGWGKITAMGYMGIHCKCEFDPSGGKDPASRRLAEVKINIAPLAGNVPAYKKYMKAWHTSYEEWRRGVSADRWKAEVLGKASYYLMLAKTPSVLGE